MAEARAVSSVGLEAPALPLWPFLFKAFQKRGVVPNWTAYRKAQVIKRYKPWMHLHMLRALRGVPVQVTWRKYRIEKDWCGRVPKGTPGPPGLHDCIWVCKNLQPGMRVPGFGPFLPGGMDVCQVS